MGLRPLGCWDCGFESLRGRRYLSVVSVVRCQIEVSASGWSPVQRSPTECGESERDCEASIKRRPWPTWGCCAIGKKIGLAERSLVTRNQEEKRTTESELRRKRQSKKIAFYYHILVVLLRFTTPLTPPPPPPTTTTTNKQTLPNRGGFCAAARNVPITDTSCLTMKRLAVLVTLWPSLFIWYAHSTMPWRQTLERVEVAVTPVEPHIGRLTVVLRHSLINCVSETNISHFRSWERYSSSWSKERRINFCISPNIYSCHHLSSLFVLCPWELLTCFSFMVQIMRLVLLLLRTQADNLYELTH